jgi:sterol desaturase/sphingolipid hydroxylase (fatty acid hydroxylase superfamily)
MLIWISFWLTYTIVGIILYQPNLSKCKYNITTKDLLKKMFQNMFITFIISIILNRCQIPQIQLPKTVWGYALHILYSFVIGDVFSYATHRLLHHPLLYPIHKIHHQYIVPNTLVGVYSHPIEMILNYLSIWFGLMMTTSYNIWTLMLEATIVSMGILLSHRANVYLLFDFGAKMHNLHHQDPTCNYGFSMIWDWWFGTLKL